MQPLMSFNDPNNPPPQPPPEVDPLPTMPPGSNPPRYGDVDQSTWNTGVIAATILAAFVIGVVVWFATNTPHPANNPPPSVSGQGSYRPPVAT
jgi:hypothetical protein